MTAVTRALRKLSRAPARPMAVQRPPVSPEQAARFALPAPAPLAIGSGIPGQLAGLRRSSDLAQVTSADLLAAGDSYLDRIVYLRGTIGLLAERGVTDLALWEKREIFAGFCQANGGAR